MISYEGIDEATLIHGLYRGTGSCAPNTPAGIIDALHGGDRVTVDAVRADFEEQLEDDAGLSIDYCRGRPLKVDLNTKDKTFDERLYDGDAGAGAAARVVDALHAKAT